MATTRFPLRVFQVLGLAALLFGIGSTARGSEVVPSDLEKCQAQVASAARGFASKVGKAIDTCQLAKRKAKLAPEVICVPGGEVPLDAKVEKTISKAREAVQRKIPKKCGELHLVEAWPVGIGLGDYCAVVGPALDCPVAIGTSEGVVDCFACVHERLASCAAVARSGEVDPGYCGLAAGVPVSPLSGDALKCAKASVSAFAKDAAAQLKAVQDCVRSRNRGKIAALAQCLPDGASLTGISDQKAKGKLESSSAKLRSTLDKKQKQMIRNLT